MTGQAEQQKFYVYIPTCSPNRVPDITIADLIPVGRENAISRQMLVALCVENGLVKNTLFGKDRAMRKLIEQARRDYTILNLSNGQGYYRPSRNDLQDLQRYIRQETKRAVSVFRNIVVAKALYEDYIHGRLKE